MAASGEGSRDAMVGVLGMITGAGIYVAHDWVAPVGLALGDYGKVTVPDVLAVPPWMVIAVLAVVVSITLWMIERGAYGRTAARLRQQSGPADGVVG